MSAQKGAGSRISCRKAAIFTLSVLAARRACVCIGLEVLRIEELSLSGTISLELSMKSCHSILYFQMPNKILNSWLFFLVANSSVFDYVADCS